MHSGGVNRVVEVGAVGRLGEERVLAADQRLAALVEVVADRQLDVQGGLHRGPSHLPGGPQDDVVPGLP